MEPFVSYEYYRTAFRGSSVPEDAFWSYVLQASMYVDYLTMNQAGKMKSVPDKVKDAVCAVCEVYFLFDQMEQNGGNVKNESNDGYSISYVTERQDGQIKETLRRKKAYYAAYPYMAFTGLMKRRLSNAYECGPDDL